MKSFTFDGRIGAKGAEVMKTKSGKPYARFSVANNSFVGGQDKTEWYDVTSYDPYVIENRVQYLTKGTYVIITGNINTEVKVGRDNNLWINHYVTATTIDTPSFKKKDENDDVSAESNAEPTMSTYTAGTRSDISVVKTTEPTIEIPQPELSVVGENNGGFDASDDLPF